jgi:Dna[CI] antecedent, DciA
MERLGFEVRRELDRFGTAGAMADVVREWPAAVGASIARNAWPARLARDGTLHVATASAAWAYELRLLEADVLEKLRTALGDSAPPRLRFAVGPLPEPGRAVLEEALERTPAEPSAEQRAEGARIAASMRHSELRALIARAAAASLARDTAGRGL